MDHIFRSLLICSMWIIVLLLTCLSAGCVDTVSEWNARGVGFAETGQYHEAVEAYNQAILLDPGFAPAWKNKGDAERELGRIDDALYSYERALAIDPDNADTWYAHGDLLLDINRNEEALRSLNRAAAADPLYRDAWNKRGLALFRLELFEDAILSYDTARAIDPDYTAAWINRGDALGELGRYEDATASFDAALAIDPADARAWKHRGIWLAKAEKLDSAIASFNKALAVDPSAHEIWYLRGRIQKEAGYLADALSSLNTAVSIDPDNPDIWNSRGDVLRSMGRYDEAVASYTRAIEIDPDYNGTVIQDAEKNTWIVTDIVREYYRTHTYREIDWFVCTDMSIGVWNMVETAGIPAKIGVGNIDDAHAVPTAFNHAWVVAEIAPGDWLALETTGGFTVSREKNPNYYRGFFFDNPRQFKDYLDLMDRHNLQVERIRQLQAESNDIIEEYQREADYYNRLVEEYNTYIGRQLSHQEYTRALSLEKQIAQKRPVVERLEARVELQRQALERERAVLQEYISMRPEIQRL
ncbi:MULTISPECIES: tetratricopeptide repeat protein [Methanocalculus]|uniref:tetratricopeptide repeat protein n=2 Tax=Methanocalculaceae TaxID=1460864 RepID=UPI0020A15BCA|nr:tetratricopeptide repeat protein [Methanocalculus sp. AMF5]MCP1662734.1 tetratricopeptide (TPR) repeat protein [Methanocalculus sp. AMF5]